MTVMRDLRYDRQTVKANTQVLAEDWMRKQAKKSAVKKNSGSSKSKKK